MKRFFQFIFKLFCFFLVIIYLVACCTQYISPQKFSYIAIFSLAFPYLFLLVLVLFIVMIFINPRAAFLFFICLLAGYPNVRSSFAFNFSSSWNIQKNDSSLRVLTWNVEDFVNLLEGSEVRRNMLHLISQNNPDVLCLQEVTNVEGGRWRMSVRKELDSLGYKYHFFSKDDVNTTANDVRITIRGTAIFSKFPFIDTMRFNIRNQLMKENAVYASILFNNKPVRIYTAHLASFRLYVDTANTQKDIYKITYDRKRAVQYKLRETEQLHQQEVKIIRDSIAKSPYPIIYCGDLNTTPCSYNYHNLKQNLQDAFLTKGFGVGNTFYKILPTLRIDVCLADKAFNVNQCTVISKKLSDHYPVITDISWK